MQEFVDEAVLSWECGFSEPDLRQQLAAAEQQRSEGRRAMHDFSSPDFIACVAIVW